MSQSIPQIATIKNQWLYQQVDVEFPTQESLQGKEIYKRWADGVTYQSIDNTLLQSYLSSEPTSLEIYKVDFHRLTVMFSLLQANRWQNESDQQLIIEFLTQIIYSDPCELFLAFEHNEPVAAAIVTDSEQDLLVSDIYVAEKTTERREEFIKALLAFSDNSARLATKQTLYIEN
ncbi:flavodoxin [Vibrio taketomensis]|uniref:flavodoxin n=1 Tax=Vibrio taketomensis TaxID=2572923 RepID=UPI0013894C60|nr:flavodoxin [Vibrio taketomensis]